MAIFSAFFHAEKPKQALHLGYKVGKAMAGHIVIYSL